MDAFGALADPTRRQILSLIAKEGPVAVAQICKPFDITPSAVSQHLRILADANFVTIAKKGQSRLYSVNFDELNKIRSWISGLGISLKQSFDRLDDMLK